MALYAIGDVQGCDAELGALLGAYDSPRTGIGFGLSATWSIAGLIRWRSCAESARWAMPRRSLSQSRSAPIGGGLRIRPRPGRRYLERNPGRPDRAALLEWLAGRPIFHEDHTLKVCMLHAGLAPQWDLGLARQCAREFEDALRRDPEKCSTPCTAISRTAGTTPSKASGACVSS